MAKRFFYGFVFFAVLCLIGSSLTFAQDIPTATLMTETKESCDALRKQIFETTKDGTFERKAAYESFLKQCPMPPPQAPLTCEQVKEKLSGMSATNSEYTKMKELYRALCGNDAGTVDQQTEMPKPPPPQTNCEMYKAKLASMDTSSSEYAALKVRVEKLCNGIVPWTETLPKPPIPNCEQYRQKLATMDPTSTQYDSAKERVGNICGDVIPPADTMPKLQTEVRCTKTGGAITCEDGTSFIIKNGQAMTNIHEAIPTSTHKAIVTDETGTEAAKKTMNKCKIIEVLGRRIRACTNKGWQGPGLTEPAAQ